MKNLENHLRVLEQQNKKLEEELRSILDDDVRVQGLLRDRSPEVTHRVPLIEASERHLQTQVKGFKGEASHFGKSAGASTNLGTTAGKQSYGARNTSDGFFRQPRLDQSPQDLDRQMFNSNGFTSNGFS
jgi:hypothetical protein